MKKGYSFTFLAVFATLLLVANIALCQVKIAPQVLTKAQWQQYFTTYFGVKNADEIKITVASTDIPYPGVWWYAGDQADKYRLYKINKDADFMVMPSNNGIGTYLFYFNHKKTSENWVEMNFVADSIFCEKLAAGIYMFQFNDDGFRINGDSSGFKRYVFVGAQGRLVNRSLVAHNCTVALNNVDAPDNTLYLNVLYKLHAGCSKCFSVDYRNFMLLTNLDDVEDLNGTIIIDAVHHSNIKTLSAAGSN